VTLVGLTLIGAGILVAPTVATSASAGWRDASLHVVGGPVVAHRMILVLNVNAGRQLELSAIRASNGTTAWQHPYSQSTITAGLAFSPVTIGSTVLDLAPDVSESNPLTYVQGLNVATGQAEWKVSVPLGVVDAPLVCGAGKYFCFTVFGNGNQTGLLELNPRTGNPVLEVPGLERNMGVAAPGSANGTGLWQSDASTPTFVQTSRSGRVAWSHQVSYLFGGRQFSPNYGWDIHVTRTLDIGSVGVAPRGTTQNINEVKTIAVATSSGAVKWRAPGMYQCMGALQFLTSNVTCVFSRPATQIGSIVSFRGTKLALSGLNSKTGALTWTEPVMDVKALSLGANVSFFDTTHVVVEDAHKKWVMLNTQNGSTTATASSQTFWCETTEKFKVVGLTGIAHSNERAGIPLYRGCTAQGTSVRSLPSSRPTSVGVLVGDKFVWASPQGLRAVATTR
jgi:outer membrane protein assembly factor BamB